MTNEAVTHPGEKDPTPAADGLYENIPHATYLRWRAINHSAAKEMRRTPSHVQASLRRTIEGDTDDSPAKILGTAAHVAMLEPGRLDALVLEGPINPRTGKSFGVGTKAWDDCVACNPGRLVVGSEDLAKLRGMSAGIWASTKARAILETPGMSEVAGIVTDPESGLRFKFRLDRIVPGVLGFDYKTTASAHWDDFRKDVARYGYHTQLEWYRRWYKAITGDPLPFGLLVQETSDPWHARVFQLGERTEAMAAARVSEWVAQLRRCAIRNEWPGYGDEVEVIDVPDWALGEFVDGV